MRQEVGISKKDFERPWYLDAVEYREIIRTIANEFSDGQCEFTHSEFIIRDGLHLVFSLQFFHENKNIYKQFGEYIKEHHKLITKYRRKFTLYIWDNEGEKNGIKIAYKKINNISAKTFQNLHCTGLIPHKALDGREKLDILLDKVHEEVLAELEKR